MLFQGLSIGMEGGINRHLVTRIDYGSGFDKSLMESSLVHLILFINHDSLPLGLAHDSCALYCHFRFLHSGFAQRDGHGSEI